MLFGAMDSLNSESKSSSGGELGREKPEARMFRYLFVVKGLSECFVDLRVAHVPQKGNKQADLLFKIASIDFLNLPSLTLSSRATKHRQRDPCSE